MAWNIIVSSTDWIPQYHRKRIEKRFASTPASLLLLTIGFHAKFVRCAKRPQGPFMKKGFFPNQRNCRRGLSLVLFRFIFFFLRLTCVLFALLMQRVNFSHIELKTGDICTVSIYRKNGLSFYEQCWHKQSIMRQGSEQIYISQKERNFEWVSANYQLSPR